MFGLYHYLKAKRKRRAVNASSQASDPAGLRLSDARLRRLCPTLYMSTGLSGFFRCLFRDGLALRAYIRDMLIHGDSRAAVVVKSDPLLVASYCDDLDGVCVLEFRPDEIGEAVYCVGDRLLTVLNSFALYRPALPHEIASDLVQGEAANPYYTNFWPLIAEFLSDETSKIEQRKATISPREYARCRAFGEEHLLRFPGRVRDGRPDRSRFPAPLPMTTPIAE